MVGSSCAESMSFQIARARVAGPSFLPPNVAACVGRHGEADRLLCVRKM